MKMTTTALLLLLLICAATTTSGMLLHLTSVTDKQALHVIMFVHKDVAAATSQSDISIGVSR